MVLILYHTAMTEFLERITWREAWVTLEAAEQAVLPPYVGSTLRGALGHVLRSELCDGSGCGHACQNPSGCRYFSLFENSRTGDGRNAPKPFILLSPASPALETAAMGGPIHLPLRTQNPRLGESLPVLQDEGRLILEPFQVLEFGIRLLGKVSPILPAMIDAMTRHGLSLGGAHFQVRTVHDGFRNLLFDRRFPAVPVQMPALQRLCLRNESAQRLRLVFLTPAVFKVERRPAMDALAFASRFFEHSLARAVQVYNAFSGEPQLPWLAPPPVRVVMRGHRLFHYELPRRSYRQEKWLDFDGVVGFLDIEGDLAGGLPFACAAEILHFGQKATFGLGKLRVLVLE
jgi:hypothetical protein